MVDAVRELGRGKSFPYEDCLLWPGTGDMDDLCFCMVHSPDVCLDMFGEVGEPDPCRPCA